MGDADEARLTVLVRARSVRCAELVTAAFHTPMASD